jgi:hypothetical protein
MQRRDFVKAILAATATTPAALAQKTEKLPPPVAKAPAPEPWMRGLLAAKLLPMTPLASDAIAETSPQFFNATQTASLRHLSELFQPGYKGAPGAIEAGVPDFLDFLIGVSPDDRKHMYQSGLDQLESESQKQFHKPFATLEAAEADQILRPAMRTWMSDHPPEDTFLRFVNVAHQEIRMATENSQAWSDWNHAAGRSTPNVDLYWYPVEPDLKREATGIAH